MKRPRATSIGWGVLLLALVLRVGWVLLAWQRHGAELTYSDETLHWQLAENLVHQGALVSGDGRYVARMPGYPLFLAAFAWAGSVGVLLARLGQCLIGALTAWAGWRLASCAFGRRAGVLAAVLLAVDPYEIFFCNLLLTEVLFTLIGVGLVAATWSWLRRPAGAGWMAVATVAVLGDLAIMTRPSSAGWVVLTWLVLLFGDGWRPRALLRVLACAGVLGALLLPWGLRNRAVVGHWAWLSANGGLTLYDALGPQADGSSDQSFLEQMPGLAALGEVERDQRLAALAIEQVRRDPWRVLRLAGVKFLRTWSLVPNVAEYRSGPAALVSAVFSGVVFLLAAGGLWRAARRRPRQMLVLWLPVVYFTIVHCVFIGSLRYRIPLMPMIEITAGAVLARGRAMRFRR